MCTCSLETNCIQGCTRRSIMAFLLLAWMWVHQFDNVILSQPCGFSLTGMNCSLSPWRPKDASHVLLLLTCLWDFTLQSLFGFSISSVPTQGSTCVSRPKTIPSLKSCKHIYPVRATQSSRHSDMSSPEV